MITATMAVKCQVWYILKKFLAGDLVLTQKNLHEICMKITGTLTGMKAIFYFYDKTFYFLRGVRNKARTESPYG